MFRFHCINIFIVTLCVALPCSAELQPEEVAIIVARGSRGSDGLAKYYAKARGIPLKNICAVDMPRGEVLTREKWTWAVRPEIRKWIEENDPDNKIRCLVTTWDVPLKIDRADRDEQFTEYRDFLQGERTNRIDAVKQVITAVSEIAPGVSPPDSSDGAAAADADGSDAAKAKSALEKLKIELVSALKQTQAHLAAVSDEASRRKGLTRVQQLATAAGGLRVILQGLNQRLAATDSPAPKVRADFERIRGHAIAFNETRARLEQFSPPEIERDTTILWLLERTGGLLASVEWLNEQIATAKKNETGACFDSELSLVMWPDDYQLLRWQPNYLRPAYDRSQLRSTYRTLMVARLDGPTLELARGLVETAKKVEAVGLQGKVYIDNRGIGKLDQKNVKAGSYADFDRSLLVTAKGIEEQTEFEVKLDTSTKLFQPGDCPDAALYCGWYSLAKYVDAFDWAPGAVAYHLASSEASTLRKPTSQVWCKRMLEDGVCATIGPVYEPYLMAFPRPNEFFSLLLQGELTLVECYYRTKPYNSWMMTLIGDPLYRPFAKKK